jgi:hypothetical protein
MASQGKIVTLVGVKEGAEGVGPATRAVAVGGRGGVTLRQGQPTPVDDQAHLDAIEALRDSYDFKVEQATKAKLEKLDDDAAPAEGNE